MTAMLIYSLHPTAEQARQTAKALVTEKLAACCNIMPGAESIYLWQNELHQLPEAAMVTKTLQARVPAVIARIRALHPYEVPAIVSLAIAGGHEPFLAWIGESCAPPAS
jgi:periplasmic divalent cation tolerance protein